MKLPWKISVGIVIMAIMLLMMAVAANGQGFHKIRDEYWGDSFPQHNPSYSNALHIDTVNKKVYRYRKHQNGWHDETDRWAPLYLPKPQPTVINKIGPANANVSLGSQGYTQPQIDSLFPNIGATPNDLVDWAYLQSAITNGRHIAFNGLDYHTNRDLVIPLDQKYHHFDGNRSVIRYHGNGGWVIRRESPPDNSTALMHYGKIEIEDLNIVIQGQNANGVSINSYYHAYVTGLNIYDADTGFVATFCLQGYGLLCEVNSSKHGFIVNWGDWAGGSNSASQSNLWIWQSSRVYAPTNGVTGFKNIGASGTEWRNCVAEGWRLYAGFEFDGDNSTVVKDVVIWSPHVELVNGCDEAAFFVTMLGGQCIIHNPFGQHAMRMVRAMGTQGYLTVFVNHCNWWVPDVNNKMFHSGGNVNWIFNYNDGQLIGQDHQTTVSLINSYFIGTTRGYCPKWKLDANTNEITPERCARDVWTYTPINR